MSKEGNQVIRKEFSDTEKAILVFGLLNLTVEYVETLKASNTFAHHFSQRLKYHSNNMIKHYDSVLGQLANNNKNNCALTDNLVSVAAAIENSMLENIKFD